MMVLVRSINVIVLLLPIILWVDNYSDLIKKIKHWSTTSNTLLFIITATLIFLPQLLYNNFLSRTISLDKYEGESFISLSNPQFLEILFAPTNGLFLYNPLYIIPLLGAIFLIRSNNKKAG
jgi:hypothetical protein